MNESRWSAAIVEQLSRSESHPLNQHELADALGVPDNQRHAFRQALHQLEDAGAVVRLRKNCYAISQRDLVLPSTLLVFPQGFAVAQPDNPAMGEVRIEPDRLGGGRHRDKVLVAIDRRATRALEASRGQRASVEGRVVKVLERKTQILVGTLQKTPRGWRVTPDDARVLGDARVTGFAPGLTPATGRKVVLRLDEGERQGPNESGEVIEDLGSADDPAVDMVAIMRAHGLDSNFPAAVVEEVDAVTPTLSPEDLAGRRDLRDELCFTIDPADARDHDDACSIRRLPNGNWELGVHIADVSHYVRLGTALDAEAYRRATSCYLADRVVPMLPNRLTTDLCSLVPHHDRLTHTVAIQYNERGVRLGFDTYPSVIHSKANLNYEQVQAFFDHGASEGIAPDLRHALGEMRELARRLRERRMREGAIAFNATEVRCLINPDGTVRGIEKRTGMESYQLIEDFMLAANQAVAEFLRKQERHTGIYRVHEPPVEKSWRKMETDLEQLGIHARLNSSQDINRLLEGANVPDYLKAAATVTVLRNLKRAHYEARNKGHFGLAFESYLHFTSPIRRYPDLIAHRVLKSVERGMKPIYAATEMDAISHHCSEREQNAEEAERLSQDLKRMQYYHDRLWRGEIGPFDAVITGFIPRGVLVELSESLQRGLLSYSALAGEWIPDASGTRIRARRSGSVLRIGDTLRVELSKVDLRLRRIDFTLAEGNAAVQAPAPSSPPRKPEHAPSRPARPAGGKARPRTDGQGGPARPAGTAGHRRGGKRRR